MIIPLNEPNISIYKILFYSLISGVGSGILVAPINLYIMPHSGMFNIDPYILNVWQQFFWIIISMFFGALYGLIIGFPTAFITGYVAIKITETLSVKIRYIVRIIIGIIASFTAFYLHRKITGEYITDLSSFGEFFIPMLAGIFGTIIFLWFYEPKLKTENEG